MDERKPPRSPNDLSRKLFAEELRTRLDGLLLLDVRQHAMTGAIRVLAALSRADQDRVLDWVGVAAQTSLALGTRLAHLAPARIDVLDAWARAGLSGFDRGGLGAAEAAWASFDADVARAASGCELDAVSVRLGRFLTGLDGLVRETGRGPSVRAGTLASTDGETLVLPARLEGTPEIAWARYKVTATLLWAQRHHGSLELDAAAVKRLWPQAEQRQRGLAWLAAFETMRLEARIAATLPGMAAEMAVIRGAWPEPLAVALAALSSPSATVADSLRFAAEAVQDAGGTASDLPPGLPYGWTFDFDALERAAARRVSAPAPGRSLSVLKSVGRGGAGEDAYAPVPVNGGADDGLAAPPDQVMSLDADTPSSAGKQAMMQTSSPEVLRAAGPGGDYDATRERAASDSRVTAERAPDARYDEWDYRRRDWRRDWCALYAADVPPGDAQWVAEAKRRNAHLIARIRRRFAALCDEDRVLGRQLDGEDIDLDAVVEAWAERQGRGEMSSRLFRRRQRIDRSLAVMFMIDMSGSTKGWVNEAEREALVLLCEALEALGDRYAIHGFSGWTHARCETWRIKNFAEPYDERVRQRIAGIEARDYTRMGVAVRHLSSLLAAEPARHKLLVTISDGRPDDYGDEYRGRYGIEDTRHALLEARAQGIRSFCLTIDRQGADYLPDLYGPAHYAVIADVSRLPEKLADVYRRLVA